MWPRDLYASWQRPFEEALTEGAQAGVLTMGEPVGVYSLRLMAIIDGFAIRALVDPENFDARRMSEMLLSTVCQDLRIAPDDFTAALQGPAGGDRHPLSGRDANRRADRLVPARPGHQHDVAGRFVGSPGHAVPGARSAARERAR